MDQEILTSTRYDRLSIFYDNLKTSGCTFCDFNYKGYNFKIPESVEKDKNTYRKMFKLPLKTGNTKQYFITVFDNLYRLYKSDSRYYFIECDNSCPQEVKEYAFGTNPCYSFIAMSIFELIKWLTGFKNKYKIKVEDEVFKPIFNYTQWYQEDPDVTLYLSLFPKKGIIMDKDVIALSIFK